ncbi:WD40 repeat domain-containing protein [Kitasatospora phosalacinea]|uniref:WD40 repeat domain-containing protein n=1 Tax=Kitasatospora phosalacinea TaxID=2065 RepID=UPI0035E1DC2D
MRSVTRWAQAMGLGRSGGLVVEVGYDARTVVREAVSGRVVAELVGARHGPYLAAFGPGADSGVLAFAPWEQTAELWWFEERRLQRLEPSGPGCSALAWSADGARLLTGDVDGTVRVWDVREAREVHRIDLRPEGSRRRTGTRTLAWHPDGRRFALAAAGRGVELRDADGGSPPRTFDLPAEPVTQLVFDPAGEFLVVLQPGDCWVQPLGPGDPYRLPGQPGRAYCAAVAPDGGAVAADGEDGAVRLWDTRTGELRHTLFGGDRTVAGLAFDPDGRELVVAHLDGTVTRWSRASGALLAEHRPPADDSYDWDRIGCACGRGAAHVPADLERLLTARTAEEASGQGLYDHVLYDCFLSEAALPVALLGTAALRRGGLSAPARRELVGLLSAIAGGEAVTEACERGWGRLGDRCRAAMAEGVPLFHRHLAEEADWNTVLLLQDLGEDREAAERVYWTTLERQQEE